MKETRRGGWGKRERKEMEKKGEGRKGGEEEGAKGGGMKRDVYSNILERMGKGREQKRGRKGERIRNGELRRREGGGRKGKEQCSLELSSSIEAEEEREVENFLRPVFDPDPEGRRRSARLGLCEGMWRVCEGV